MTFQILVGCSNHQAMGDLWWGRSLSRFFHVVHTRTARSICQNEPLAGWTCVTQKNLDYGFAHHESPLTYWLQHPTGIWKVMGFTPIGGSENYLSV